MAEKKKYTVRTIKVGLRRIEVIDNPCQTCGHATRPDGWCPMCHSWVEGVDEEQLVRPNAIFDDPFDSIGAERHTRKTVEERPREITKEGEDQ